MYPSIFNSFPDIRTASAKNRRFHVPQPTFSPGDAPATITQYVPWMERQFNACQTPRSMYLSIFNNFRVIRCLSQCISPKIAIFPHFCFPWGCPWGNHAKCCMDRKRILNTWYLYRLVWFKQVCWAHFCFSCMFSDYKCTCKLYADDVQLRSIVDQCELRDMLSQLDALQQWSDTWQLNISYSK